MAGRLKPYWWKRNGVPDHLRASFPCLFYPLEVFNKTCSCVKVVDAFSVRPLDCPDAATSTLRLGAKKLGAGESYQHLSNIHKTHLLSQGRATSVSVYVELRNEHQTEARVSKQRRGEVFVTVTFHTCIFQSLHRLQYSTNIKSYLCMSAAGLSTNF